MTTADPERWKKIDEIFAGAVELQPDQRAAFVAGACGDDERLCAEVMSLLDGESDAKAALHGIVGMASAAIEPEPRSSARSHTR